MHRMIPNMKHFRRPHSRITLTNFMSLQNSGFLKFLGGQKSPHMDRSTGNFAWRKGMGFLQHTEFGDNRWNMSYLRGEKPQNQSVSNFNTGVAAGKNVRL